MSFTFEMGKRVSLIGGALSGVIVGRVEYADAERAYLLDCDEDGKKRRHWLDESLLTTQRFLGHVDSD